MNLSASHRSILAVYSLAETSHRDHFSGVLEYLAQKHNYSLAVADPCRMQSGEESVSLSGHDGIIVSLDGGRQFMSALAESDKPTVLVNIDSPRLASRSNISCVWLDNTAIGKAGAAHLLGLCDFASFGFVPDDDGQFYNKERGMAFRSEILRKRPSVPIGIHDTKADLSKWLSKMPKPAAVMAADASAAHRTLEACRQARLAIPRDVALLSVDQNHYLSERSSPTISCILPNFKQMGYIAAKELDRLMTARSRRQFRETVVSGISIVERESTVVPTIEDSLAGRAVLYVRTHADSPMTAQSVARALGRSRRLVDLRLRAATGHTLRELILDERLAQADNLLRMGLSVKDAARRLGFTSANYLTRAFSARRGETISSYLAGIQ